MIPESLSHIIGGCARLKECVIKRHNEVGTLVENEIAQKNPEAELMREFSFDTANGRLKPDLAIKNRGRVQVVDYTIRYEDKASLEDPVKEKIDKYSVLKHNLCVNGEDFEVTPIVLGVRGVIPKATVRALERLQIYNRSTVLTLTMNVLRSSIEMANSFLDTF